MSTETKISESSELDPYQIYGMMLDDYSETRDGLLQSTAVEEFGIEDKTTADHLRELRSNIGYFALREMDMPVDQLSKDLGMDAQVLTSELEMDERLIDVTSQFRNRFNRPSNNNEGLQASYFEVDPSKLKWVTRSESVDLISDIVTNKETGEKLYRLVDLTPLHRTTSKMKERLQKEGVLDRVMGTLKNVSIPALERAVLTGSYQEFRPVDDNGSKDKDRSVKSKYPAYKFGINGPQNRAVIILLGKNEDDGLPQYGLASICDHEDQEDVLRVLSHDNTIKR